MKGEHVPLYWEDGPYKLASPAGWQNEERVAMGNQITLGTITPLPETKERKPSTPVEKPKPFDFSKFPVENADQEVHEVVGDTVPTGIQLGWGGMLFITVGAGALAWGFWTLWPTLQRSFGS